MRDSLKRAFADWCIGRIGCPVLWAGKGSYFVDAKEKVRPLSSPAYDCSGLVTCGVLAISREDLRDDFNAQKLSEACPTETDAPEAGDLLFYGRSWDDVVHVAIALAGGHCISADGATASVRTFQLALERNAQVRFHDSAKFRKDYLGCRINVLV